MSFYQQVEQGQTPDASSWVFSNPQSEPTLFHYRLHPLAANQVRIKNHYIGLSTIDLNAFTGRDQTVPGSEVYGEIVAVGENAQHFKVGDRVGFGAIRSNCGNCQQCHSNQSHLCLNAGENKYISGNRFGGYSTFSDVNSDWVFPIPNSLPHNSVAPLLSDGVNIYAALTRYSHPSQSLGIIGFNGLSRLTIKFAVALGYKNITIVAPAAHEEAVKAQGLNFIPSENPQKLNEQFHSGLFTLPTGDTAQMNGYFNLIKRTGHLLILGQSRVEHAKIGFFSFIGLERQLIGVFSGNKAEHFETLKFAAKHKVYPDVQQVSWQELPKAFHLVTTGQYTQSVVVKL